MWPLAALAESGGVPTRKNVGRQAPGLVTALAGVLYHLLPDAAYLFGAAVVFAFAAYYWFSHRVGTWWLAEGGPGSEDNLP